MRSIAACAALLFSACGLDVGGNAFFWPVDGTSDEPGVTDWVDEVATEADEGPDTVLADDPDTVDPPLMDTLEVVDTYEPVPDEVPFELVSDPVPDPVEEEAEAPCIPIHGGACGLVDSCGCGTGMACRLRLSEYCLLYEDCVTTTGTLPMDAPCTPSEYLTTDPCLPGNICLERSGSAYFCYKWCITDEDCPTTHACTGSAEFWSSECGRLYPDYGLCLYK